MYFSIYTINKNEQVHNSLSYSLKWREYQETSFMGCNGVMAHLCLGEHVCGCVFYCKKIIKHEITHETHYSVIETSFIPHLSSGFSRNHICDFLRRGPFSFFFSLIETLYSKGPKHIFICIMKCSRMIYFITAWFWKKHEGSDIYFGLIFTLFLCYKNDFE